MKTRKAVRSGAVVEFGLLDPLVHRGFGQVKIPRDWPRPSCPGPRATGAGRGLPADRAVSRLVASDGLVVCPTRPPRRSLIGEQKPRSSLVDPFQPFLVRRIDEGCLKSQHSVSRDHQTGLHRQLRHRPQVHRAVPHQTRPTGVPRLPSVRQVTGWICRHPDSLVSRDTEQLQNVLNRCPELRSAVDLVRSFTDMITHCTANV